jgi:cyclophilin family peptidyl-prolyl cis-trans isomerase/HEAT repeat protein
LLLQSAVPALLHSQDEVVVSALAPLLEAEDTRAFDETLFRRALLSPDSLVRRIAALSAGRIGDLNAIPLLVPLLVDSDTTLETTAAFALGLLADSSTASALITRLQDPSQVAEPAALELITALAKIGGPEAGRFFARLLAGSELNGRDDRDVLTRRAVVEAWRLGRYAPVDGLLGLLITDDDDLRWSLVFSLGRLKAPAAAPRLLDALNDRYPPARAAATRALTKAYADSAKLEGETVARLLLRNTDDADAGVRIQALRSLATFHRSELAAKVVALLDDPSPGVAVEAAATLGEMPDPNVAGALVRAATRGSFARRRAALLSLAKVDSSAFLKVESSWTASGDWRERAVAAEAWATVRRGGNPKLLQDADGRVVAAALDAWGRSLGDAVDPVFIERCRSLLTHRDAAVRSVAADGLARSPTADDVSGLIAAYQRAGRDSFPEARLSSVSSLAAIARSSETAAKSVDHQFLQTVATPDDYIVRRWAEENWPAAAARWGPAYPLRQARTLEDYRDIARTYLVGQDDTRYPHVKVDVDQLGVIDLELYGPEAPLTVANFLRLVDRGYFNGLRWHRVVPNFVVQTGDPRGDGWGGPGGAIRDEINPRRYKSYMVGMALSGPDTGGSQWFITLGPQPHLDGTYTVFGEVTDGYQFLNRITQGDLIRSIKR